MGYFEYGAQKIFYVDEGSGKPLLLLAGNTASSAMFGEIVPVLKKSRRVLSLDFFGTGKSGRGELCEDLWYNEAMQAAALLDFLGITGADVIGTSGGAIAGINLALERPELVNKLIADSFEGERALPGVAETISESREASKKYPGAVFFYKLMNGEDWEAAVDADTAAIRAHAEKIGDFFHKPISEIQCSILLTGSREDDFFPGNFYDGIFDSIIAKTKKSRKHIFEHGAHPAMLTNGEEFFALAEEFFGE